VSVTFIVARSCRGCRERKAKNPDAMLGRLFAMRGAIWCTICDMVNPDILARRVKVTHDE